MKFKTALELGRVSNLPTVWTNVACAMLLTQAAVDIQTLIVAIICLSLFYLAGMFLNDYFDTEWDRQHNNLRPIVRGETNTREVLVYATIFILSAFVICVITASSKLVYPLAGATLLLSFILLYDWKHKSWSFGPWLMGACRFSVYLTAAGFIAAWNMAVAVAGLALLFYIAGITYLAKAEQQNHIFSYIPAALLFAPVVVAIGLGYKAPFAWILILANLVWIGMTIVASLPNPQEPHKKLPVPKLVGRLLAGICLGDAMLAATTGNILVPALCLMAFLLCLFWQKHISAT